MSSELRAEFCVEILLTSTPTRYHDGRHQEVAGTHPTVLASCSHISNPMSDHAHVQNPETLTSSIKVTRYRRQSGGHDRLVERC
jgi:hypothetical protein